VDRTEAFLRDHDGHRRVSFDSITELAYYADEERAADALGRLVALLEEYDAVGLFHVDREVHDEATIERFASLCSGVLELDDSGQITASF
jgi:archaellum biogenesis ATPase FlaH